MKKLPKIITKEEYDALLTAVAKSKIKNRKQYFLAMVLAAEAGLRISEIVGFKRKDGTEVPVLTKDKVDVIAHRILISSGEGKKDRIVPCPKKVNERAVRVLPIKIGRRSIQRYVTQLGWDVLKKPISFHTLRHYFGTQCAEKMPLHEVQMLIGHSRLDTTGIYLHANPVKAIENAREVFD